MHTLSITDARKVIAKLAKHDSVLEKLVRRADISSHVMRQTPQGRVHRPEVKLTPKFFREREEYALKVVDYVAERIATKGYAIADKDRKSLAQGLMNGFFVEDMVAGMLRLPGAKEKFDASAKKGWKRETSRDRDE